MRNTKVIKLMGRTDDGFPETPVKMGNVRLARIVHGRERGCSFCFPHGPETSNSMGRKNRRSWKYHRKTKYCCKAKEPSTGV